MYSFQENWIDREDMEIQYKLVYATFGISSSCLIVHIDNEWFQYFTLKFSPSCLMAQIDNEWFQYLLRIYLFHCQPDLM